MILRRNHTNTRSSIFPIPEYEEESREDPQKTLGMEEWDDMDIIEEEEEDPEEDPEEWDDVDAAEQIGSTSNAHATVSAPMIITSVDEPVSQVEEFVCNLHYLFEEIRDQRRRKSKLEKKLCEWKDKVEKKEKEKVEMKKYIDAEAVADGRKE
ncbi:hypothetical protein Tco_1229097 [Tanacetum coccineum]